MYESFVWVKNCIRSCTNSFQLDSAKVLIGLFNAQYPNEKGAMGELQEAIIQREIFLSVDA